MTLKLTPPGPSFQAALARLVPGIVISYVSGLQHRSPLARPLIRYASRVLLLRSGRVSRGIARGLYIDCGDSIFGYLAGTAEPRVQAALPLLVHAGDTVYDVGANIGFFTLGLARLVGCGGKVWSFEPMTRNAETLRRNVSLNKLGNVTVLQVAIAEASRRERLLLGGGSTVAKLAHTGVRATTTASEMVDVVSLDALYTAGRIAAPRFIKMDIEGAEGGALRGMRGMLRDHRPVVLCELHETHQEVEAVLREVSYTCFGIEAPELGLDRMKEMHWNAHFIAFPEERAQEMDAVRARLFS